MKETYLDYSVKELKDFKDEEVKKYLYKTQNYFSNNFFKANVCLKE